MLPLFPFAACKVCTAIATASPLPWHVLSCTGSRPTANLLAPLVVFWAWANSMECSICSLVLNGLCQCWVRLVIMDCRTRFPRGPSRKRNDGNQPKGKGTPTPTIYQRQQQQITTTPDAHANTKVNGQAANQVSPSAAPRGPQREVSSAG